MLYGDIKSDLQNYVDVAQVNIGSCTEDDIAGKVLTRIISHYPDSGHMLIDCGWLALTLDSLGKLSTGFCVFEGEPNLRYDVTFRELLLKLYLSEAKLYFEQPLLI